MTKCNKIRKPKLKDGSPIDYEGNHHLWYLKQYKKWLNQKEVYCNNAKYLISIMLFAVPIILGYLGAELVNKGHTVIGYIIVLFALSLLIILISVLIPWTLKKK